jgi:hypothetical protein
MISLKEESTSSRVNQGYDQLTAKNDKKNAAESLYDKRKAKKWQTGKAQIDQYDLVPTANQLRRGAIIKDYVGNNATRKCARRKLNSYGYRVGHCGVVNDSGENMNRMQEQLVMADSVSEIHRKEVEEKVLEKLEKNELNDEKAPVAVRKLEDKGR